MPREVVAVVLLVLLAGSFALWFILFVLRNDWRLRP